MWQGTKVGRNVTPCDLIPSDLLRVVTQRQDATFKFSVETEKPLKKQMKKVREISGDFGSLLF